MGNCLGHGKSSAVWAGEDWGSLTPKNGDGDTGKKRLLGHSPSCREVKITISKKELEELVKRVNKQGRLSLEEVLARMVREGSPGHEQHWKPELQSIPEVD